MTIVVAVVVGLMCGVSFAQDDRPLTITKAGYFLTEIGADGKPVYIQLTTVIDLTGGKPPDPKDPDEPQVYVAVVEKVQGLAKAIDDPLSAQVFAIVYAHVRGALEDGTLTSSSVWTVLQNATSLGLDVIEDGKDWSKFRQELTEIFTEARQRGKLGTIADIDRMLLSVQHGVELAADGSTALSMDRTIEVVSLTNSAIDQVTGK